MRPWKSLCALAVTFSVIAAVAFLPFALADMEDRHFIGVPCYAEITPVELQMSNSTLNQLLLLSSASNSHEITKEQAILTVEELEAFVVDGLKPYFECGVLPFSSDFSVDPEQAKPYLFYDAKGDSGGGSVLWIVALDIVGQGTIELVVDDNTGKILMLGCSTQKYFGKIPCSPENALHLYMNTYLDGLGIDDLRKEFLGFDQSGPLNHVGVLLRHSDLSGYIIISFLADEWGLNMQIQSESEGAIVKDK